MNKEHLARTLGETVSFNLDKMISNELEKLEDHWYFYRDKNDDYVLSQDEPYNVYWIVDGTLEHINNILHILYGFEKDWFKMKYAEEFI